jgi:putative hydrolase of the HAD superfamily
MLRDMSGPKEATSPVVLLDMGNTLVAYFSHDQWPAVRTRAIEAVADLLDERGLLRIERDALADCIERGRGESEPNRVNPLADRLRAVFDLPADEVTGELDEAMAEAFCRPLFACGRVYDDTLPVLTELRRRGVRTGILSNTPWGTPGALWRRELERLGLVSAVDEVAFCTDCGWRKPARQAFEHLMGRMNVTAGQCVFVGDDPRWDVVGPEALGMRALLIDRTGRTPGALRTLHELVDQLDEQGRLADG